MFKITAMTRGVYQDLIDEFELPQENLCSINVGDVFYTDGITKPEGLCDSAWETMIPFINSIKENKPIFRNWMRDDRKALVSCNDGFRPISFLIERIDDK
ncbi:MAG: TIGR04076 family protein [Acholeplasmatales bacterium]|nr:TIGR04076 family protein [Acholeplasmatales bacterium]